MEKAQKKMHRCGALAQLMLIGHQFTHKVNDYVSRSCSHCKANHSLHRGFPRSKR